MPASSSCWPGFFYHGASCCQPSYHVPSWTWSSRGAIWQMGLACSNSKFSTLYVQQAPALGCDAEKPKRQRLPKQGHVTSSAADLRQIHHPVPSISPKLSLGCAELYFSHHNSFAVWGQVSWTLLHGVESMRKVRLELQMEPVIWLLCEAL